MQNYKLHRKAVKDLVNIKAYTRQIWSDEQSYKYLTLIKKGCEYVSENFMLGQSIDHIKEGYRKYSVKSHFLIYRKSATDDLIEIIRILHKSMDIENKL
jgi:toxin ParE1/3/4